MFFEAETITKPPPSLLKMYRQGWLSEPNSVWKSVSSTLDFPLLLEMKFFPISFANDSFTKFCASEPFAKNRIVTNENNIFKKFFFIFQLI